jgi:hypothetical protein
MQGPKIAPALNKGYTNTCHATGKGSYELFEIRTHYIVDLCMIAGDRKAARALFRSVRTNEIRDKILEVYPVLRVSV